MIQVRNCSIFFVIASFVVITTNAQHFATKAILTPVEKTGFYAINISPELSSYTIILKNFQSLKMNYLIVADR